MPFARLNGWQILAAARQAPVKALDYVGEGSPRWRNRPTRERRSIEQQWRMTTTEQDELCADTLEGLLEGEGHHFPFITDAWSESGLGPQPTSSFVLAADADLPATRGHYVVVSTTLAYNAELVDDHVSPDGGRWSVSYWYLNGSTWERHLVRSDGTGFIDGIQDNAGAGTGLTVSSGAVVLSAGSFADLTILPFYVCDDFAAADFAWVSGLGLVNRWRFDDRYLDDIDQQNGTPVGSPGFGPANGARGLDLDGATESVLLPDQVFADLDGRSQLTLQAWVRVDTLPVSTSVLLDGRAGGASNFIKLRVTVDNNGMVGVFADISGAGTDDNGITATTAVTVGTLQLLTVTINLDTNITRIFLDDTQVGFDDGGWSGSSWAGGVNTGTVRIGRDSINTAASLHWDGTIADVRLYDRTMTAAQVSEVFRAERSGQLYPGPTFQSALPRTTLWGDINGNRPPVEVIGMVDSEGYVQHGGDAGGWTNNDRETVLMAQQVKREVSFDRVPSDGLVYGLRSPFFTDPNSNTANLRPVGGLVELSDTNEDVANRDQRGPFNWPGVAHTFDGSNYWSASTSAALTFADGANGMSMVAWVRPSVLGVDQYLMDIRTGGGGSRAELMVTSGNQARFGGRSQSADSLQSQTSTSTLNLNEWVFIGGTLDLATSEVKIMVNGVVEATLAATFGADRVDQDVQSPFILGGQATLANFFTGRIASAGFYRRALTAGEMRRMFELGKQGLFS